MDIELLVPFAAFLAVAGGVLALTRSSWQGDARVDTRLDELSGGRDGKSRLSRPAPASAATRLIQRTLPTMAATLLPDDDAQRSRLQTRLMQAGIYSPQAPAAYQMAKALLAVLPAIAGLTAGYLGLVPLHWGNFAGGFLGAVGMLLPSFWVDRRKARRHTILNRSLPDAIDLMVACVEGGLSLEGAMQRVTEELRIAHPLLAGEMSVVQRQMEFGSSADAAIQNFADRTGLESIQTLSALVQQARRYGTGISEALRSHAEMIRVKREQMAEEMAQKAAVKILFPTLLFIFPSIFVVLAGPAAIQLNESFAKREPPMAVRK